MREGREISDRVRERNSERREKVWVKILSFIFLLELISVEDKNFYISEKKNLLIKFNVYVILVFLINDIARRFLIFIYVVIV